LKVRNKLFKIGVVPNLSLGTTFANKPPLGPLASAIAGLVSLTSGFLSSGSIGD